MTSLWQSDGGVDEADPAAFGCRFSLPTEAAMGHGSRSAAVAKPSNRRRSVACSGRQRRRRRGKGWRANAGPSVRPSERASGWRRATFIAVGRSEPTGQRLLIATPDCKSTRRAADA